MNVAPENGDVADYHVNVDNVMLWEEAEESEMSNSSCEEEDDDNYSYMSSETDYYSVLDYYDSDTMSEDDFYSDEESLDEVNSEPLYPGAKISVGESMTCILQFYLRHHQSDSCLSDLLSLIEMHCPPENKCAKTLYFFKKWLGQLETPLKKNFYCSQCFTRFENNGDHCSTCSTSNSISYFISIPLESQLEELFKRPGFYNSLSYRFERQKKADDNLEDMYDGLVYRSFCVDGEGVDLRFQSNISFTWNTDGAKLYKSSNFSIWPQFCMINELDPKERKKKGNMLLTALWFGPKKPHPDIFLEPLATELEKVEKGLRLYVHDLDQSINIRGIVLCATCDLPAKALFLNMQQYNATEGCHKCKIQVESVGRNRVYTQTENIRLRTTEETERYAAKALDKGRPVHGVKGPTFMSQILSDFIRWTVIDPMHLLSGLGKTMLEVWLLPKHRDYPSSIATYSKEISNRIIAITPPSFVERLPRKIDDFAYWKASEIITWLLMYSTVILKGIMSEEYLSHHLLLISGIHLLYQNSVSDADIDKARELLHQYVKDFARLYAAKFMISNLHSLLHLADLVGDFGPLWVFTCFPFENANGILKSLVHATRDAQIQICKGVSLYMTLEGLHDKYVEEGSKSDLFYRRLEKKGTHRRKLHVTPDFAIVGLAKKLINVPHDIREILTAFGYHQSSVYRFHCLVKDSIFYSSQSYTRRVKTNSSCVSYMIDDEPSIGIIQSFIRVSNCNCRTGICGDCADVAKTLAIVKKCTQEPIFSTSEPDFTLHFINRLTIDKNEPAIIIDVSQLRSVYFQITVKGTDETFSIKPIKMQC